MKDSIAIVLSEIDLADLYAVAVLSDAAEARAWLRAQQAPVQELPRRFASLFGAALEGEIRTGSDIARGRRAEALYVRLAQAAMRR